MHTAKPRLALILGDPAGVGPELVARKLADPATHDAARVFVVSDADELASAMDDAGVGFDYGTDEAPGRPTLVDNADARPSERFARKQASRGGGLWALANFRTAFGLARAGTIDAVVFAPLNKTSLHLAGMQGRDEMEWFETVLDDGTRATELNILPELTTARVTSHVSIGEVADLITFDLIVERALLLDEVLKAGGTPHPRIGVCALNPHAGDNGNFGRHEIDTIAPAVAELAERGLDVRGPIPSDTIFVQALTNDMFDGVLTMYHDQGQIAMKLTGFDRGVTMAGGLSVPVCTPAHGTAFDIVGERKANLGAFDRAFEVACQIGARRRSATEKASS